MNLLRQQRQAVLMAVLILLALFIVRPGANGLRRRIVNSVSLALGRKVDVQWVKLRLLPQPGFDLVNFVVYDDPGFSAEPVLRAEEVTAVLRIRSLVRGRLEIGRLSLKEPSFNLVRSENGHWNIESLLERAAHAEAAPTRNTRPERRPIFPYIEADNGRINFKVGLEKKSYSLTDADFALWLESDDQWGMRLRAQPVRTDFNLTDTGTLRVNGTWQRSGTLSETPLNFSLRWDRAQLGELTKLLYGRDMGWRGALLISADLSGSPAELNINLTSSIDSFRRYDIIAQQSLRLSTSCQALYSSIARAVSNLTCISPVGQGLLSVKGRVEAPTGPRNYDLTFTLERIPIQSVADLARRTKKDLPDDLAAAGTLDGTFHLQGSRSSADGLQWSGTGSSDQFVLRSAASKNELALGTVPFEVRSTLTDAKKKNQSPSLPRSKSALVVGPFQVALGKQSSATVSGWADTTSYHLGIQGEGAVQHLLQLAEISGLQAPRMTADGSAKFNLVVAGDWHGFAAPRPTGRALLKSVNAQLPGVNGAVEVRAANVVLDLGSVHVSNLVASAAGSTWEGSLSFPRPCHLLSGCAIHFDLRSDAVAADRLHQWFSPSNRDRPWYNFAGFGSHGPSLFNRLTASGTLAANRLVIRGVTATHVSCKLDVHDGSLRLSEFIGDVFAGHHNGEWTGNLAVSPPEFSGTGKFERVDLAQIATAMHDGWIVGAANGSYAFTAAGKTVQEWLASSKGTLLFDVSDGSLPHIVIASGAGSLKFRRFSGRMALRDGIFEVAKGNLENVSGLYEMTGIASADKKLQMKLAHSGNIYIIDGTLSSPHVAPALSPDTRASLKP
jgi:hypothetical protein